MLCVCVKIDLEGMQLLGWKTLRTDTRKGGTDTGRGGGGAPWEGVDIKVGLTQSGYTHQRINEAHLY